MRQALETPRIATKFFNIFDFNPCGSGVAAARSLSRDGGVEELHGDPKVRSRPKVWTGS